MKTLVRALVIGLICGCIVTLGAMILSGCRTVQKPAPVKPTPIALPGVGAPTSSPKALIHAIVPFVQNPTGFVASITIRTNYAFITWTNAPTNGVVSVKFSPDLTNWWYIASNYVPLSVNSNGFFRVVVAVTNPPSQGWAIGFGSPGKYAAGSGIVASGSNVFSTGYFSGSLGGTSLSTTGNYNAFLFKHSTNGTLQWSKQFGGGANVQGQSIAVDTFGDVILGVIGNPSGTLVKFDSTGNTLWTAGPVITNSQQSCTFYGLRTDTTGNIFGCGTFTAPFSSPLDFGNGHLLYQKFNPGPAAFLVKYSASGVCQWVTKTINGGSLTYAYGVAPDSFGNVFLGGYALGNVQLCGTDGVCGPQLVNGLYATFGYLGKFDSSGILIWSKIAGSEVSTDPNGSGCRLKTMSLDYTNIITSGDWGFAVNFGGGRRTGTPASSFIAKFSQSDGAWIWDSEFNGSATLSQNATIGTIVTGQYSEMCNFGGVTLSTSDPKNGFLQDGYVARYSSTGINLSAIDIGSTSSASGNGVAVDTAGGVYVIGGFQTSVTINGQTLNAIGNSDVFIGKIAP